MTNPDSRTVVELVYSWGARGAVEGRAALEAKAFAHEGHRVVVITDRQCGPVPPGVELKRAFPVAFHRALPNPIREVVAMLMIWARLAMQLRRMDADVVVFHSSTLSWPANACARRRGARSVFVVHALIRNAIEAAGRSPYGRARTLLYNFANSHGLRNSKRVIAVSGHIASTAAEQGAPQSRVRVVPNAIDLRRFGQLGSARDVDVVFAGRLVHEKGPDVLLAALRHVRRPLRVVVAGDGPCRSELVNYARRAGLDVTFTGWLSATDLPALLSRAAVQVVPSRSEAQGIALLEGLAAGTPVVASRVGGIPEIVRHGENGWLVPPDDPLALARALDHALSERGALDTMRAAARDSVRVFDLQTFPKRLQREYLE